MVRRFFALCEGSSSGRGGGVDVGEWGTESATVSGLARWVRAVTDDGGLGCEGNFEVLLSFILNICCL